MVGDEAVFVPDGAADEFVVVVDGFGFFRAVVVPFEHDAAAFFAGEGEFGGEAAFFVPGHHFGGFVVFHEDFAFGAAVGIPLFPFAVGFVGVEFDFAFFAAVGVVARAGAFGLAVFVGHDGGFAAVVVPVGPFAVGFAVAVGGVHFFAAVEVPEGEGAVVEFGDELADLGEGGAVGVGVFAAGGVVEVLHAGTRAFGGVFAHVGVGGGLVGGAALLVEVDFLRGGGCGGGAEGEGGEGEVCCFHIWFWR